jgi:alkylhydroperoxidase family enzyme
VIDASPRAAWLFSRLTALGQFRRDLLIEAWCAAGITAVRHEDCGPCTQLGVTMAERAGVSPAVLRAVLADNADAMPPDVALVWKFTQATLAHDAAADDYREAIVNKCALGHGKACMRVVVGGTPVMFDHGRVPAPADVAVRTA